MNQAGFPIPLWLLVIDAIGMGLIVVGILALFGGRADSMGAFGDPVAAAGCLVAGVLLVGGSVVHIALLLRARAGQTERKRR